MRVSAHFQFSQAQMWAFRQLIRELAFFTGNARTGETQSGWGDSLHAGSAPDHWWAWGESCRGNQVEVSVCRATGSAVLHVNSTRHALDHGGNNAGYLFLRLSEIVPPQDWKVLEYQSQDQSPAARREWWLPVPVLPTLPEDQYPDWEALMAPCRSFALA